MNRRVLCVLLTALGLGIGFSPRSAAAQGVPGRGIPGAGPPAVSPYLNLLRRGSDPAVNYYGLVRPEVETRNSIQTLQQQVTTLGAETAAVETPGAVVLPPTGHPTRFRDYSRYFSRLGTAGAGAGIPVAPARAAALARPAGR
jgi:hypothetical protein